MIDWFALLWLGVVGFIAWWQAAWAWRAIKTGVATYYFHYEIKRDEKPFQFRMLVIGRIVGFVVAIGMLIFGAQFFWRLDA